MTPIHVDEKWLENYPELMEKIRQAEEREAAKASPVQEPPPAPQRDAPGGPESGDQTRPNGFIPPSPPARPRKPYSWRLPAAVAALLLVAGVSYAMGHRGSQGRYIQAVKEHVAQVTAQAQPREEQTTAPQETTTAQTKPTVTRSAVAPVKTTTPPQRQASATVQQNHSQAPVASPITSPPSTAGGETMLQWWCAHNDMPHTSGNNCVIPLPNGTIRVNSCYQWQDDYYAIKDMPVSVFEDSRAPIIGQISGSNDLAVTLEISGPNGTKVLRGKLDSGAEKTMIPTSDLAAVGLTPTGAESVIGVTGSASEGIYQVPTILVRGNSGQWEDLANAATVWGSQFPEALVGADVLKQYSLSVSGNSFVLGF